MSVLDFCQRRATTTVLDRLTLEAPELSDDARAFQELCRASGLTLSLSRAGLARLDAFLRSLCRSRPTPAERRSLVAGAGAVFGCIVIECVGGSWQPSEAGHELVGIGERAYSYDPFEPVDLLLSGRGEVNLGDELATLRADARGRGPRSRFEDLFEDIYLRLTGRSPGVRESGFRYRTSDAEWVFLHNLYRRALDAPEGWPDEIENFVRKLEGAALEHPLSSREAAQRIYPALKQRVELSGPDGHRYVQSPVSRGLVLAFAVDYTRSMSFVTQAQSRHWGLDASSLRRIAFDNLGRRNFALDVDAQRGVVTVGENDGYDAVRALLPGVGEKLKGLLGCEPLLALPHRDLLIAFDPGRGQAPSLMAEIRALYCSKPYALAPGPFRRTRAGLQEVSAS